MILFIFNTRLPCLSAVVKKYGVPSIVLTFFKDHLFIDLYYSQLFGTACISHPLLPQSLLSFAPLLPPIHCSAISTFISIFYQLQAELLSL